MTEQRIRLLIVDDHEIVRRGLRVSIQTLPDVEIVGEAENGKNAVEMCLGLQPDVILLDLLLPDVEGIEVIKSIRAEGAAARIIVLTNFKNTRLVHQALELGAIGYLLKNISIDELSDAIQKAYEGKATLSPEAAEILREQAYSTEPEVIYLTDREKEVLALLSDGLSNPQIAEQLTISPSTVKNHVSNILEKFGAVSRTELVSIAIRQGYLSEGGARRG